MDLKTLQQEVKERGKTMKIRSQTSPEIMLGILEEAGEVAKEVALFEKVGNKINWKRLPDKDLLAEEISHLLVNVVSLSSYYDIDLEQTMKKLFEGGEK